MSPDDQAREWSQIRLAVAVVLGILLAGLVIGF